MIGTAGYDTCIGSKFAAFLAQSGKANPLALSKLNVPVVHLSNGNVLKYRANHRLSRMHRQIKRMLAATVPTETVLFLHSRRGAPNLNRHTSVSRSIAVSYPRENNAKKPSPSLSPAAAFPLYWVLGLVVVNHSSAAGA
jgi:hypothetical protein